MPSPLATLALGSLLLLCSVSAVSAKHETLPLLRGILIDGSGNLFSLADSTGSATWVKIGQTFDGWRLESFDAERRVLTVARDGVSRELTLESSSIQAGESRPTLADADALLTQLQFEEMIAKSLDAQQKAMAKAFAQGGGRKLSAEETAKVAEMQAKALNIMMEEMDLPNMRKEVAQAMTEIYTPEEIRAQAAFYSTAVGQSTIEKQPQFQSRLSDLMMPRIMRAMPKIQAAMAAEAKSAKSAAPAPAPAPAPDAR
jgi:Uncharacterized protein conserved in bacteria